MFLILLFIHILFLLIILFNYFILLASSRDLLHHVFYLFIILRSGMFILSFRLVLGF